MFRKTRFLLIVLMLAFFYDAASQNSQVLYYMKLPQNNFLNPAIKPANRFYIGLPVITGINAGLGNNFLSMSDIVHPGDTLNENLFKKSSFDLNKLAGKLVDNNTITTDASIQLLGLGMTFGKDLYIYLDIADRTSEKFVFPRSLVDLYMTGPAQYIGKTIDLSGLHLEGQYYREYGLGFSKNITGNLRIGAKVKLLSGIASMSLDDKTMTLTVNATDTTQTVTTDAYMGVSGKTTLHNVFNDNNVIGKSSDSTNTKINPMGFIRDYLKIPVSNAGMSFDVGAVYNIGTLITLSASITDLGFINWKKDLKAKKSKETFTLPGITLDEVKNGTYSMGDMVKGITDSIKNSFRDTVPGAFKTYLPMNINAGVSLNLLPVLSLGVLSNTRIYAGTTQESLTFSANAYLGRILSASASYTMANYSYNNLGFGLGVKAGIAQFYLIADKIPLSWEKIVVQTNDSSYSPMTIPQNMNMINVQLGLNLVFGKPVTKKTDKPMVVVQ